MTATTLETKTCSRCGGSGSYSYCQMHGSTCFGCGGSGKQYTKRGRAAALYLQGLRKKRAGDVTFGDWVKLDGVPGFSKTTFFQVETLQCDMHPGYSNDRNLTISGKLARSEETGSFSCTPDYMVPMGYTKAQKQDQLRLAIAYQETLTKTGTPRKRSAKEVA